MTITHIDKTQDRLEKLSAKLPGSHVRVSARGVPHIVGEGLAYSIAWFGKHRKYRLFYPYASGSQSRRDFKSQDALIWYVAEKWPENES